MAQTKPKAGQFYGVSDNGTDGQFLKTDGTGGMSWASTIVDPAITSIDYPGSATAADPAGGESVIINGTLFASGITCTVGGTSAVTAFNSATQITITTPAKAAGPYTVAVTNPDGGTASQANFIQYSGVPVWSTAAGTLGNVLEGAAASFQVTATEGSDTIEYAVTTGTLPTGLSLATATGAITGTAPTVSADTTTTFSITATDDENQTSASRSFSITVTNDGPSNHFASYIYTGNGGTQNIPLNFSPGLTWIKSRTDAYDHNLYDIVRGADGQSGSSDKVLMTNKTNAQEQGNGDVTITNNGVTVVETNTGGSGQEVNKNNSNYVSWNFKAGGAAVANTDGSRSSEVSANNTLGFSIVKWTGDNQTATIGHGLSAAPELIIVKKYTGGSDWPVYSSGLTSAAYRLVLNSGSAQSTTNDEWNSTAPTSTVFSVGSGGNVSDNGQSFIGYCFTSKPGFSKVGSYTGNGSANGPIINTGFEPAWLMVKRTDSTGAWNIQDNKRNTSNPRTSVLQASSNDQEYTSNSYAINFLTNGFQIVNSDNGWNTSGGSYIYLAIAADGSTATPSLANSFNTTLYSGSSSTPLNVSGIGFKADFSWLKARNNSWSHGLFSSLMPSGVNNGVKNVYSNNTDVATDLWGSLTWNSNGWTLNGGSYDGSSAHDFGASGYNFVSWNWKAGGTPSINTDGSTTSLVSANQAAGFSIVKFSGNLTSAGNIQVGHGLNVAPELIIQKNLNGTGTWWARPFFLNSNPYQYLSLSESDTLVTSSSSDGTMSIPTSTTFDNNWNTSLGSSSGTPIIAYCFKSISGFSKVGSYIGTGATGNVQYVGFEPSFVMVKATSTSEPWFILDNKRNPNNPRDNRLMPDSSAAESTGSVHTMNFNSNNFTLNGTVGNGTNGNGQTYIYLAIKEN